MCENDITGNNDIDITKIFDRFYKADENRTHTSSGLGLSIAKMLSDRMNEDLIASITADNKFRIILICKMEG